jgi:hypothetical protein
MFTVSNVKPLVMYFEHSFLYVLQIPVQIVVSQDINQDSISFLSPISIRK